MNDVKSALAKARKQAQELHQNIQSARGKDQAAMRAELSKVADKARQLGDSLKTMQNGHRGDEQRFIASASSALEEAAAKAKTAATAGGAQLASANAAALERTRTAIKALTVAVAAERAKIHA